jgi:hypothetical protein
MSNVKKLMMSGAAGGGVLIDDVFRTFFYEGTGNTAKTIDNGIDLAGFGGLVWAKPRSASGDHNLYDTERGIRKLVKTSRDAQAEQDTTSSYGLQSFNSNGFSLAGNWSGENENTHQVASYTFRKQSKFFDIVTYTGNGTSGRQISHNLGSVPGSIWVTSRSTGYSWACYHRSADGTSPENYYWRVSASAAVSASSGMWNNTAPTASNFTVGNATNVNANGVTYVAYIFAHNDGDGNFGPDGDQDIIKCGRYVGNGSSDGPEVNLGFRPQWLLIKTVERAEAPVVFNEKWVTGPDQGYDKFFYINTTLPESTQGTTATIEFTPDGFKINNSNNIWNDYISPSTDRHMMYIAIREGNDREITDASDVFYTQAATSSLATKKPTGFFPRTLLTSYEYNDSSNTKVQSAELGYEYYASNYLSPYLQSNSNSDIQSNTTNYGFNDEFYKIGSYYASSSVVQYAWKRHRGYHDTISWKGNGTSGKTVKHNLGVVPEMMWVKCTNQSSTNWIVYHSGMDSTAPEDYAMFLNLNSNKSNQPAYWNDTAPTDTTITLGNSAWVNNTNYFHSAWLFASLDGVSKVGSYVGQGSSNPINVDCGFTNGASFVLIKAATQSGDWSVNDSARGINAGNDTYHTLHLSSGWVTGYDIIDPYNQGFTVVNSSLLDTGVTYIYYAVA